MPLAVLVPGSFHVPGGKYLLYPSSAQLFFPLFEKWIQKVASP